MKSNHLIVQLSLRVIDRMEQAKVHMDQSFIPEGCQQFNYETVQMA
jgi:hypothetical protein